METSTAETAESVAAQAAALLAEARAQAQRLHLPGVRDAYRGQLERAIAQARAALEAGPDAAVQRTLLEALTAQAEDARYGAGQLSRGSQRAPTRDDCEDGWLRVEGIVRTAEAAATEAADLAKRLGEPRAARLAEAATRAAGLARDIVRSRNHAYTFHADPGFSFGEGWYLAAAATLDEVEIQIEPEQRQTAQATRFLLDAGLSESLVPYRSRPRANKHLPEIVARSFREDPACAQAKLRRAFLGEGALLPPVVDWADRGLREAPAGPKVLMWVRYAKHHAYRNTTHAELTELCRRALRAGLVPVLVGDALREGEAPAQAVDWTLFWKQALFQGEDMRRAQLHLFEHLQRAHGLVGQVGVTTAGMDGPALVGLATLYLTPEPNPRLGTWVGAVPGYEEVVQDAGYLDRIELRLRQWAGAAQR